jgi:YidC/Oxa1 family membrane protein insertase
MEKRAMLAMFLSLIVMLVFWVFLPGIQQKPVTPPSTSAGRAAPGVAAPSTPAAVPATTASSEIPAAEDKASLIEVTTETTRITLTTKGGAITSWEIKEKSGQWIDLAVDQAGKAQRQLCIQTAQEPYLASLAFQADKKSLSLNKGEVGAVTMETRLPNGVSISRVFTFAGEGYLQKASVIFQNKEKIPVKMPEYTLSWGPGLNPLKNKTENNTAAAFINGQLVNKMKPGTREGSITWAALSDQYFIAALIPEQTVFTGASSERNTDKRISAGLAQKEFILAPGETKRDNVNIYAGPKEYYTLKAIAPKMEELVGFGSIGKFFYFILRYIYKAVHNYGWAIIILTLILQIVLLPLTLKSYHSMKEMQTLQPLMKQLQEKYKDDPKRLNVEVMNLYKAHKVNPFGGCLPMLLQLPIFFALYNTIRYAVELRQAPFIFWIKDLSLPDTVAAVGGININILPLIMGVAMFVQQKMSTADPQQAKMVMFMPVIFTFMFWNFPSGLVLYWFVNSLVSMAGQYLVTNKKYPKVEIVK